MLKTNLPREYFVSDEIFARETEQVFSRHWICVGHLSEFGDAPALIVVQIDSYSIVVIVGRGEDVRAFHNVCRHRGARLCTDDQTHVEHTALVCPYHGWTYNLNGQLIGAPNMTDQPDFDRSDFPLHPVAAACWHGFVMLRIQPLRSDFSTDYQPISDRLANWTSAGLSLVATLRYQVRANWKMLFQNFNECYHCPAVHPALNRLSPYSSASNDLTSGPFLGGPMELAEGVETLSGDGKLVSRRFPHLTTAQRARVFYYSLFPTLLVSAHPDYLMVHVITRTGTRSTDVACHFLVPQNSALANHDALSRATEFWDEVNRQDWQMCQRTQLGAESPAFRPGPYSSKESMVLAFDRHYLEVMDE